VRVKWSKRAEADLDDIMELLADEVGEDRALDWHKQIKERGKLIGVMPGAHPERKVGSRLLRGCPFKSWMIWYTVGDKAVRIERVILGRRDQGVAVEQE
jgi:plasmid stabilization system protein ParE